MRIRLSRNQISELSKYWFDLSKLTFASLILKLFEPGIAKFDGISIGIALWGLMGTIIFATLGLEFSKNK
ncbi:MAG TPA: hypothetical protein VL401_00380 [Alphaproteobacteria bacterium]|jgi:hypothetical protein|nr:hypothetical protein [Alphaproteobacteria bacterium]